MEKKESKEKLIRLFKFDGKPYLLKYEYRKKRGGYQEDKPILNALIRENLVKMIEKTSKTILFQYIGD